MKRGYWKLIVIGGFDLDDADREHISKMVLDGYTEGEVIHDEIETERQDYATCPHCGWEHSESDIGGVLPYIPVMVKCDECGRKFSVETFSVQSFTTKTIAQAVAKGVY